MSKCDNCIHGGVCHYIMFGGSDEIENCRHFDEARPKGKWIIDGHHIRCNRCNEYTCDTDREGDKIPNNFCPNCGAKMVNDSVINAIRDNNKRYDERPTIDFDGMQYDLGDET